MSKKIYVGLLVILLVSLSIPVFPINSQDSPISTDPIDLVLIDPLAKVNSMFARGVDYTITAKLDGKYIWSSAPTYIYDGSRYVPYIYNQESDHHTIQVGLIGAELYRNKAVFYSPDMEHLAVGRETWLVYQRIGNKWVPVCASLTPYFVSSDVDSQGDSITISGLWETGKGTLQIDYEFEEKLKHTIIWTPNQAGRYAIVQFWNETKYDQVLLGNNTVIDRRNKDFVLGHSKSLSFTFFNDIKPFGIYEDQYSAREYLHKTLFVKGTVNYEGITITDGVAWIFYNSTKSNINAGEQIVIDPTTQTSTNPTVDGFCSYAATNYYRNDDTDLRIYRNNFARNQRSYWRWDISAIPDSAVITNATLEFQIYFTTGVPGDIHFKTMFENGADWVWAATTLLTEIAAGDTCSVVSPAGNAWYTAVFNQTAFDQIEYELTDEEQFQFGAMLAVEDQWEGYYAYAEEQGGADIARCNITFYALPTITSATITDMDDTDNCYTMKKYYTFVVVVDDSRGADTITDVYLQGRQDAAVRFEVRATNLDGAPVYSIESGAAAIDLDTISCSWGEAGDVGTATFTIRFEWDYAQEDDGDLAVYVEDDAGNSTGFTIIQTDYFDVISRLTTTGFEATRNYVVRGGPVTLFGYVRYATTATGNVSSTSYPPDSLFTAVHIHNSVDVSQGSDTTIVDGYFRVTFNIPDEIQANSYHVYLDMTG